MADPVEQSVHGSQAGGEEQPAVVSQPAGQKKGSRVKSREPSRVASELGDVETRLAKVELKLLDVEEKFEEIDLHLEKFTSVADEFREEVQTALNGAIERLASNNEMTRHSLGEEVATLKEENRFLLEELDRVLARVREVVDELALLKRAVAQGSIASPYMSMGMAATP